MHLIATSQCSWVAAGKMLEGSAERRGLACLFLQSAYE